MPENYYQMICRLGTFMICARTILHFRPKETYEKYLKLLLNGMLLVQLFQPIIGLMGISATELQQQIALFQEKMEENMQKAAGESALSEERLSEMSLQEIQKRLAEQAMSAQEKASQEPETAAEKKTSQEPETAAQEKASQELESAAEKKTSQEPENATQEEKKIEIESVRVRVAWK